MDLYQNPDRNLASGLANWRGNVVVPGFVRAGNKERSATSYLAPLLDTAGFLDRPDLADRSGINLPIVVRGLIP